MYKRIWLLSAIFITLFFGIVYIAIQQSLRQGANDPQNSMVQDVAVALAQHRQPSALSGRVEMAYDMAPFVIVYDNMGNAVTGNGYLNGKIPTIPFGVLQHTPATGHTHSVTWQPANGVRVAAVSTKSGEYYIVSGRSLFVVENRIRSVTQYMAGAWMITVAGLGAAFIASNRRPSKKEKHTH